MGCGVRHLSQDCNVKKAVSIEAPKPHLKCADCFLEHPSSDKGCSQFPVKPQFRKTYANVTTTSKNQNSV